MARLPTIGSRPAPKRKPGSSPIGAATKTAPTSAQAQVTKAAKRAARRQQMLQASAINHPEAASRALVAKLTEESQLSKSALRRRKRKLRDQAVLGKSGMDELRDQLEDVDSQDDNSADEQEQGLAEPEADPLSIDHHGGETLRAQKEQEANRVAQNTRVGNKLRKRVLAQEQLRQPYILKDLQGAQPSQSESTSSTQSQPALKGFAAIRQHAKNTLGLSAPAPAPRQKNSAVAGDADVQMQ